MRVLSGFLKPLLLASIATAAVLFLESAALGPACRALRLECNPAAALVLPTVALIFGFPFTFLAGAAVLPIVRNLLVRGRLNYRTGIALAACVSFGLALLAPLAVQTSTPWTPATYASFSATVFIALLAPSIVAGTVFVYVVRPSAT